MFSQLPQYTLVKRLFDGENFQDIAVLGRKELKYSKTINFCRSFCLLVFLETTEPFSPTKINNSRSIVFQRKNTFGKFSAAFFQNFLT